MRTSALISVLLMLDSRCQTERRNGSTGGQLDDTTESDVTGARSLSSGRPDVADVELERVNRPAKQSARSSSARR